MSAGTTTSTSPLYLQISRTLFTVDPESILLCVFLYFGFCGMRFSMVWRRIEPSQHFCYSNTRLETQTETHAERSLGLGAMHGTSGESVVVSAGGKPKCHSHVQTLQVQIQPY